MAGDASTVAANPAGMTLLDRTQLLGAAGALLPFTNFDLAPQTTTSGGGGGNAGVFTPIGGFFYVYKLSEKVSLGLATDSDFGLSGNYGKPWAGRYYVTQESLITGKANPSIAYRVNDWLSVGAGFSFSVGRLLFQSKVNNVLPRTPDGGLALESWDEAFGGNAGVLLTPIKNLRVGLTYQSPIDYKFGFRPHVTNLGPLLSRLRTRIGGTKINIPMEVPQQVMLERTLRCHVLLEPDGKRRMAELVRVRRVPNRNLLGQTEDRRRQPALLGHLSDRDRAAASIRRKVALVGGLCL